MICIHTELHDQSARYETENEEEIATEIAELITKIKRIYQQESRAKRQAEARAKRSAAKQHSAAESNVKRDSVTSSAAVMIVVNAQ